MADNLTTQSATPATIPATTVIATIDASGSDGHVQRVSIGGGETCTGTTVAASATSVQLLAATATRLGATLFNDSGTATVYVKFGTTASATDFVVRMAPGAYYEVPVNYRGRIDGIWTAASGSMRIGEIV